MGTVADRRRVARGRPARGARPRTGSAPRCSSGPTPPPRPPGCPRDVVLNGMTGSIGLAADAGRARPPAARSRWPTRSRSSPAARWSRPPPRPGRSCRSTPSTPRSRSACAAARAAEVRRLVLTASGGPFRGRTRDELADVTPEQALAHPTWDMGPMVTTNSATLVNKGLEVIEAHLLFDIPFDRHRRRGAPAVGDPLDGRVHRRLDARPGEPARHAPADRARSRLARPGAGRRAPRCDWTQAATWTFVPLDDEAFPAVGLARRAGEAGGTAPGGLQRRQRGVRHRLPRGASCRSWPSSTRSPRCSPSTSRREQGNPRSVEDVLAAEDWARARARELTRGTP